MIALTSSIELRPRMTARMIRIIAACILAVMLAPAVAAADGDPASDVPVGENAFYPYSPPVSTSLQRTLNGETAAAARAHFPIKVALIASPTDLGAVPNLFDQPQKYADFLDQEISFEGKRSLLVVMPAGYGQPGDSEAPPSTAVGTRARAVPWRTSDDRPTDRHLFPGTAGIRTGRMIDPQCAGRGPRRRAD